MHLERQVIQMPRRKILFVIVEGPSDEEALGVLLTRIYNNQEVYVYTMHCDITTESTVNSGNIVAKIGNIIKGYAGKIFRPSDFSQIIHIIDTDGAFIPDDFIVQDNSATRPLYSITEIRTNWKAGIVQRNRCKRENVNRLISTSKIWNVPYQIYYMSCNLDHVLYGKLNCTDIEKENNAFVFAKKYRDDIPGFLNYISESEFSVVSDYNQSWQYIREGLHSLERHTNLGLCLKTKPSDSSELKNSPNTPVVY